MIIDIANKTITYILYYTLLLCNRADLLIREIIQDNQFYYDSEIKHALNTLNTLHIFNDGYATSLLLLLLFILGFVSDQIGITQAFLLAALVALIAVIPALAYKQVRYI